MDLNLAQPLSIYTCGEVMREKVERKRKTRELLRERETKEREGNFFNLFGERKRVRIKYYFLFYI